MTLKNDSLSMEKESKQGALKKAVIIMVSIGCLALGIEIIRHNKYKDMKEG